MRRYWWLFGGDQSTVTQRSAQLDMLPAEWGNAYAGYSGLMAEYFRESVPGQQVSVRKSGVKTNPDAQTQATWNNQSRPPLETIMHGISVRYFQNPGQMSALVKQQQLQPRDTSVQTAQALQSALLASMLAQQTRSPVYG